MLPLLQVEWKSSSSCRCTFFLSCATSCTSPSICLRKCAFFPADPTAGSVSWTWESCALNTCLDVVYADSLTAVSAQGFSFAASGAATRMVDFLAGETGATG